MKLERIATDTYNDDSYILKRLQIFPVTGVMKITTLRTTLLLTTVITLIKIVSVIMMEVMMMTVTLLMIMVNSDDSGRRIQHVFLITKAA